jgi:hypothetical protein
VAEVNPEVSRRLRGCILRLLRARHDAQLTRMDDVALTHALQNLAYSVGINLVVTLLQDLGDRGYIRFTQRRDFLTGRVRLDKLELSSAGRDLVEENVKPDPAVEF